MLKSLSILLITMFCTALQAQHHYCDKAHNATANLQDYNALRRANPKTANYDIIYHRLELTATVKKLWLVGKVTSYFKFNQSSNTIAFNIRNHLRVDSVKMGIIKLTFNQDPEYLNINLYRTFNAGELDSLTVFYQGNPSLGKQGAYFIQFHPTGKVLATQSEPYGAPDWWPCKQDLMDKFDSCDMLITTDTGYLAGGPGNLVSTTIADSMVTYHWQHRYPSNFYLLALAISNYTVITDTAVVNNVNIPIVNYVYPHLVNYATPLLKNTIPLLRVFDSMFGEYPYIKEKYGHMQWNRGGGMEHATMSSMGNFSFDLVAHELAHQWFGNKITCSNWQDIWINESFATYLNAISYELIYGKDSFYSHLAGVLDNAKKENSLSVFVDDTTSVSRIFNQLTSYQKGAMVLQTMRVYMGEDAFFRACKNFITDSRYAFGVANTNQLLGVFQQETNKDLTSFLQSHYYGTGYPTYFIRWNQKDGILNVEVDQSTSNLSGTFFPQTIMLHAATDTGLVLVPVNIEKANSRIALPFQGKINELLFNKNNEVLASGTVALLEESANDRVSFYPNPGKENLTIRSNKFPINSVYIYNSLGKEILAKTGLLQFQLDMELSGLQSGTYLFKINIENNTYIKRYVQL